MQKPLLLILFFLITLQVCGQKNGILGFGLSVGAMNYKGDNDYHLSLKYTKPAVGLNLHILPYSMFNFSLNYVHGSIRCDDSRATTWANKYRNLNFYSNIDEFSVLTYFRFQDRKSSFTARKNVIPYVFAGVALFHFNPKTKYLGKEYELQKIGTEGQQLELSPTGVKYPSPYKLTQISIPFGAGAKYKLAKNMDLGAEMGWRKTFTDYLDDLSGNYPDKSQMLDTQGALAVYLSDPSNDPRRPNGRSSYGRRGDSDKKDWYIFTNVNFTYYLVTNVYKSRMKYLF